MTGRYASLLTASLLFTSCTRDQPAIDPQLATEIAAIKAIDNHAHPPLVTPGDRDFDALPVDSMEPASDPSQHAPTTPP